MPRWIKAHAEYQTFMEPDFQVRTAGFFVPVIRSEEHPGLGITISKKVGKAVLRNLLRRRIKSWVRLQSELPVCKINLVARASAGALGWDELCAELEQVISLVNRKLAL